MLVCKKRSIFIVSEGKLVNGQLLIAVISAQPVFKVREVLLGRLDAQNPGLQAEGWFVTYRQSGPQGTLLALGIGENLVEYLGARKDRVYFLNRLIDVRVRRSHTLNSDRGIANQSAPMQSRLSYS